MHADKNYLLNKQYKTGRNLKARASLHRFGTNPEPFWSWVAEKYPFKPNSKILEVGAGTGVFWLEAIQFIPENCEITISDLSAGMLAEAKVNLANLLQIDFTTVDVEKLPFPDKSFDAVLAHFMLYHASSPLLALQEIKRVLDSNGFVGIILPSKHNLTKLFSLLNCESPIQAQYFPAEKAIEVLPKFFTNIQHHVHKNTLNINEIEPIITYVQSLPKMDERDEDFYNDCRTILEETIKKNGCLSLDISQHLFIGFK